MRDYALPDPVQKYAQIIRNIMSLVQSSIQPVGLVDYNPAATFGRGQNSLRIGNGGAGSTGLIHALAQDFLRTVAHNQSIDWVCNHSLNTQVALRRGYIDVALTYERHREEAAIAEGWCRTVGGIFHDHFVLAGPLSDPANIRSANTVPEALAKIAACGALFHSRADGSATMEKERRMWAQAGLHPWDDPNSEEWYMTTLNNPSGALIQADMAEAYLLSDRSTLLRQTVEGTISNTTVFIEPDNADHPLMNSCYGLYATRQNSQRALGTFKFLEYLMSPNGQDLIASFGEDECGVPFFANLQEGYARTSLAGGRPHNGRWIPSASKGLAR